ncbi:MAG: AraC family transcriptional regulator [Pseudomonadota bacterium]
MTAGRSTFHPINSFQVYDLNAVDATGVLDLANEGHLLLLCPLHGMVEVDDRCIDANHYTYLQCAPDLPRLQIRASTRTARLLLCFVSPAFVREIAAFLGVPGEFTNLLERFPLPQGDDLSTSLVSLAATDDPDIADEIFMDIVGQVVSLQRARHAAMQRVSTKKHMTQAHLVNRLLVARQYIDARYLEPLSTRDVAKAAAISEYYLARLFRSAFATSVHQYLLGRRMHFARAQFGSSRTSITEVAAQLGYRSLSAFITAFRKAYGMTPSAYRASLKISRK